MYDVRARPIVYYKWSRLSVSVTCNKYTVDLDIFVVQIFFVNHKIKKHEMQFTTDKPHFSWHGFTAKLASYFKQNVLFFDTRMWLMENV